MDDYYDINNNFDIIFCRNVIIYFDRITQEKVLNKLCTKLKPEGYFFLGHSESITNMKIDLETIKPTIYRKKL
jgi:chemotaxis protein methyltransferase CheR